MIKRFLNSSIAFILDLTRSIGGLKTLEVISVAFPVRALNSIFEVSEPITNLVVQVIGKKPSEDRFGFLQASGCLSFH
jgi:hypothetical protein